MSVYAIDHIQVAMPPGEENAARAFYGDLLDFAEIVKPSSLAGRGGVWFSAGGAHLHLGVEQNFRPARKAHPAFLTDDLDAVVARLQAAGVQVSAEEPPLAGYRRVHVADPFGNRIELMEKTPAVLEETEQ
jgi:catechol 2,3-dioxygenase-like lactoylglutathione lyase family enzyme